MTADDDTTPDSAEEGTERLESNGFPVPPSPFTCPDCGGSLWELQDGELIRFECHVGHAYNGGSLMGAKANDLEIALWTALRTLEENAALRRRMAHHARQYGMDAIAESYDQDAKETEERAQLVRRVLVTDTVAER